MPKRKTKEEFIEELIEIYGDRYDLSKIIKYTNTNTKVTLVCKEHGDFERTPKQLLNGIACSICKDNGHDNQRLLDKRRRDNHEVGKSFEEFELEGLRLYNNRYSYKKENFYGSTIPMLIYCNKHDTYFKQTPFAHLRGNFGCKECTIENRNKTTQENYSKIFIDKSSEIHNHFYDYSKVDYVNSKENVIIICPIHGEFLQKPANHLSGRGCYFCGREKTINGISLSQEQIAQYIEEMKLIHNNIYDYSLIDLDNFRTNNKIKIICPIHGVFEQIAYDHKKGIGCNLCGIKIRQEKRTFTKEQFIENAEKVHGVGTYDYSSVVYINSNTKVTIYCKKHKTYFYQTPANHVNSGQRCPICSRSISKGELIIKNYLDYHDVSYIYEKGFEGLGAKNNNRSHYKFDFYLQDYNTCIEFDGLQHFEPVDFSGKLTEEETLRLFKQRQRRDRVKNKYCKDNKIKLIRIRYDEIDTIYEILLNNNIQFELF